MKKPIEKFHSVSIFVLATNETDLLRETVLKIQKTCAANDLDKIIIVVKSETCPSYFVAKNIISENDNAKVELHIQQASTIELCIAELPKLVQSSHFVIMAADMETDPNIIKDFIARSKDYPERIICAAKWHKESVVEGYGKFHEFGSRMMNTFISILFNQKVKDPFSIYQIYPFSVYDKLNFDNPSRFAYEYTLKPLRYNIEYEEIPTIYKKRTLGKSNFNYMKLFQTAITFCWTAVKLRFSKK